VPKEKPVAYLVTFELFAEPDAPIKAIKAEIKMLLADYGSYKTKNVTVQEIEYGL
jgi:hypothetical protein